MKKPLKTEYCDCYWCKNVEPLYKKLGELLSKPVVSLTTEDIEDINILLIKLKTLHLQEYTYSENLKFIITDKFNAGLN